MKAAAAISVLSCAGALALACAWGSGPAGAASDAPASSEAVPSFTPSEIRRLLSHSPLDAPPPDPTNAVADDPAAARLGQFLFFDPRLSADGTVSCARCHDPELGFADGLPVADVGTPLDRHTMTLWNVAHGRWFFWDGRADALWTQVLEPFEQPNEHGTSRDAIAALLHDDHDLHAAYAGVFGSLPALDDGAGVDELFANVGKSIAAYLRRLERRRAPFDTFVEGLRDGDDRKRGALGPAAQRGAKVFLDANCRMCHFGPSFTDGEFHATGIGPRGGGRLRDAGRYEGIRRLQENPFRAGGAHGDAAGADAAAAADKSSALIRSPETWGQFKTPTLRNVALSPPYMHQGQLATLADVVRHYSTLEDAVLPDHHREQILQPLGLTEGQMADLVAFLEGLTGAPPAPDLLRPPPTPHPSETTPTGP